MILPFRSATMDRNSLLIYFDPTNFIDFQSYKTKNGSLFKGQIDTR